MRVDNAKAARRSTLLRLLVPWLHNVELVDPNADMAGQTRQISLSLPAKLAESQAASRRVLKGEGWGSAPATEMLLNDLMYITVKVWHIQISNYIKLNLLIININN